MIDLLLMLIGGAAVSFFGKRILSRKRAVSVWVIWLLGVTGSVLGGFLGLASGAGGYNAIVLPSFVCAIIPLTVYWLMKRGAAGGYDRKNSRTVESAGSGQIDGGHPVAIATQGDIFISYSNSDRPTAQALARALQDQGWSVWWDEKITIGKTFPDVIAAALGTAKCVIVLWSKDSVTSKWVKTEASEGAKRDILLPVLLAEVTMPLEFRQLQAANLVD